MLTWSKSKSSISGYIPVGGDDAPGSGLESDPESTEHHALSYAHYYSPSVTDWSAFKDLFQILKATSKASSYPNNTPYSITQPSLMIWFFQKYIKTQISKFLTLKEKMVKSQYFHKENLVCGGEVTNYTKWEKP